MTRQSPQPPQDEVLRRLREGIQACADNNDAHALEIGLSDDERKGREYAWAYVLASMDDIAESVDLEARAAIAAITPSPSQSARELIEALGRHCFAMSERHLNGYRLIIGFETREQVQAAHGAVADLGEAARAALASTAAADQDGGSRG